VLKLRHRARVALDIAELVSEAPGDGWGGGSHKGRARDCHDGVGEQFVHVLFLARDTVRFRTVQGRYDDPAR
jgi:hypothetical protein